MFFWSENAHKIIPGIWVGNYKSALDKTFLTENNIQVVVNCTPEYPFISSKHIEKLRVPVRDSMLEKDFLLMEYYFKLIIPYLVKKYKSNINILIHCHAGKQRSCILMAALLKTLLDTKCFVIKSIPSSLTPKAQFFQIVQYIVNKRPQAFTYGFKINFRSTYERYFCID